LSGRAHRRAGRSKRLRREKNAGGIRQTIRLEKIRNLIPPGHLSLARREDEVNKDRGGTPLGKGNEGPLPMCWEGLRVRKAIAGR